MEKIILPSITSNYNSNWQQQIIDVKKYELSQVALFLSAFDLPKRQACYQELEQLPNLTIPFVHAKSDMPLVEYKYLLSRFGTQKFNLHPSREFPPMFELGNTKKNIFIENTYTLYKSDLLGFAGICLDLSHLENTRLLNPSSFKQVSSLLNKFPIGANHISAIGTNMIQYEDGNFSYEDHHMSSLDQFNYLKKYHSQLFAEYIAIELNNSITEQLELISYLKQILKFL